MTATNGPTRFYQRADLGSAVTVTMTQDSGADATRHV